MLPVGYSASESFGLKLYAWERVWYFHYNSFTPFPKLVSSVRGLIFILFISTMETDQPGEITPQHNRNVSVSLKYKTRVEVLTAVVSAATDTVQKSQ